MSNPAERIRKEVGIDPVFVVLVGARWLNFAAVFALFGCSFFAIYAGEAGASAGPCRGVGAAGLLLRVAAPVAAATTVAWLVATMATMAGGFGSIPDPAFVHVFFFETPFGPVEVAEIVLSALLVAACLLPTGARLRCPVIATVAAAQLVGQAWLGHAAEGGDTFKGWAMIVCYAVHVIAGAAWLGGLPALLVALAGNCREDARDILGRFSAMASIAVAAIVASGVANTLFRVGWDIGSLAATTYGAILAAKLCLVAAMLGFAAYNRFVAMPRLAALGPSQQGDARLPTSIAAELGVGLLVLGAVAVLGITAPPG